MKLRHQFVQGGRGVFSKVIPAERLKEVISAGCKYYRGRLYSPLTTLRMFISQALSEDKACQDVLCHYLAERTAEGELKFSMIFGP